MSAGVFGCRCVGTGMYGCCGVLVLGCMHGCWSVLVLYGARCVGAGV